MKQTRWFAAVLLVIALLVSPVMAGEKIGPSDIPWLFSGELMVQPHEFNGISIGRGGVPTGFAFAPGRAELAYSAVEETDNGLVSVLRIVQVEKLERVYRISGEHRSWRKFGRPMNRIEVKTPFAERERQLLSLEAKGTEGSLWGPFIEGPITWSPDGARLVVYVISEDASKSYASRDLWVVDYKTGQREVLTSNMWVTIAAWSPNSRWLAFVAESAGPKLAGRVTKPARPGLWLFDVQAGERTRIADGAVSLEWSKDSSRLRFRRSGDSKEAQEYELETEKLSPISSLSEARPWEISPDGRYIATMNKSMEGSWLEVRERTTGALRIRVPAQGTGCWHADSRILAYFGRDGALMITAVERPDIGHAVKVAEEAEYNVPPFQAPLQWSSQATLPTSKIARKAGIPVPPPEPMLSWIAVISKGELRVLCIYHGELTPHEKAAWGRLSQEEEREIVGRHAKEIVQAIMLYAYDWDEHAPPSGPRLFEALQKYVFSIDKVSEVFDRPGYPNQPVFRYLLPDGFVLKNLRYPTLVPIGVIDYWEEGGFVALASNQVKWYPREELEEVLDRGKGFLRQAVEGERR